MGLPDLPLLGQGARGLRREGRRRSSSPRSIPAGAPRACARSTPPTASRCSRWADVPIRESAWICEWLEETHPDPPLWPADPALRGWARGWAKYIDDTITADFFLGMRKMAFGKADDDPEDVVERLHAKVPRRWPVLEEALGTHAGPWLCGEQFTFADLLGARARGPPRRVGPAPAARPGRPPACHGVVRGAARAPSAAAIDAKGEPVAA